MLLTWFNKVKGYSQSRQGDFLGFVKLEVIIFISFHILYIEPEYIFPQKLLSLFVKTIIILKICPSKFNIVHFFMLYNHMFCSFWNPQDYAVFTLSLYYNWTKNSTITFTFFVIQLAPTFGSICSLILLWTILNILLTCLNISSISSFCVLNQYLNLFWTFLHVLVNGSILFNFKVQT